MQANELFPQVVSEYKELLKSGDSGHVSLSSYCRSRHVSYRSVSQWMRRHGMDGQSVRLEALLEKQQVGASGKPCDVATEKLLLPVHFSGMKEKGVDVMEQMKGVSLTFPDGVVVCIKETSWQALNKFIESYNKTTPQPCLH